MVLFFNLTALSAAMHVNAASLKSLLEIQGTVSQKENSLEVKIV